MQGVPTHWPEWAKASLVNLEAGNPADPYQTLDAKWQYVEGYDPVATRQTGILTINAPEESWPAAHQLSQWDSPDSNEAGGSYSSYETTPAPGGYGRPRSPTPTQLPDPSWDRAPARTQPSPNDSYMATALVLGGMPGLAGSIILTTILMLGK